MENEIKVNEYVRTKYGEIGKITETFPRLKWRKKKASSDLEYNLIQKHSPNLVDLIQCGDLVKIEDNCGAIHWFEVYENSGIYQYDILEISTKEMMESISYKVERK